MKNEKLFKLYKELKIMIKKIAHRVSTSKELINLPAEWGWNLIYTLIKII